MVFLVDASRAASLPNEAVAKHIDLVTSEVRRISEAKTLAVVRVAQVRRLPQKLRVFQMAIIL